MSFNTTQTTLQSQLYSWSLRLKDCTQQKCLSLRENVIYNSFVHESLVVTDSIPDIRSVYTTIIRYDQKETMGLSVANYADPSYYFI